MQASAGTERQKRNLQGKKKVRTIRLPDDLEQAITDMANEVELSWSAMLVQVLRGHKKLPDAARIKR